MPICFVPRGHRALALLCCAFLVLAVSAHPAEVHAEGNEGWTDAKSAPPDGGGATAGRHARGRSPLGGPSADGANDSDDKRGSLSGGALNWQASSGCLAGSLRGVLADVAATFGPVTVTSTCRSRSENRAAGGAGHSYHLEGEAADFRISGNTGAVYAYLASNGSVGGLKHYGGGLFHIDTGPRRSW